MKITLWCSLCSAEPAVDEMTLAGHHYDVGSNCAETLREKGLIR